MNHHEKPEDFFVFIVGVNGDWEEERKSIGDIALYNEYLAAKVPDEQVIFVKDEMATRSNCENELQKLLHQTCSSSTFVFYYGGHGHPTGFETNEEEWLHQDIVQLIDSLFCGDRAIFYIDSCASGNFCKLLKSHSLGQRSYACLASAEPYTKAGPEWTLTSCIIKAMRSNVCSLSRFIDFLADETAKIKGDCVCAFLSQDYDYQSCTWTPNSELGKTELEWLPLKQNIPLKAKVNSSCRIGDLVYYKHPGGSPKSDIISSIYIPPLWIAGTVISKTTEDRQRLILKVECPITCLQWKVEEACENLLNSLEMASTNVISSCLNDVQVDMARNCKYLDFSLEPETLVQIVGERKHGKILDLLKVDWEDLLVSKPCCSNEGPFGPHVVVGFDDDTTSIIPLEMLVVEDSGSTTALCKSDVSQYSEKVSYHRECLVKSIESCGKSVCHARDILPGNSSFRCFFPEDEEWYDTDAINPSVVALEVLACHTMFNVKGPYCPMYYEDNTIYLTPRQYIFPKSDHTIGEERHAIAEN